MSMASRRQSSGAPSAEMRNAARSLSGPLGPCSPGIHFGYTSVNAAGRRGNAFVHPQDSVGGARRIDDERRGPLAASPTKRFAMKPLPEAAHGASSAQQIRDTLSRRMFQRFWSRRCGRPPPPHAAGPAAADHQKQGDFFTPRFLTEVTMTT